MQESREKVTLLLLPLNLLFSICLTDGFNEHLVIFLGAQYEQVTIRKLLTVLTHPAFKHNLFSAHQGRALASIHLLISALRVNYEVNVEVAHLVKHPLLLQHLHHLLLLVFFLCRVQCIPICSKYALHFIFLLLNKFSRLIHVYGTLIMLFRFLNVIESDEYLVL